MELPVDSWYRALKVRHSRRLYTDKPIAAHLLDKMEEVCTRFQPFAGVRGVLIRRMTEDIFRGLVGAYGKVRGASTYLAFLGERNMENVEARVGYLGEALILEATALGLSTCWISGFFDPWVAALDVKPQEKEKIYAVSPLGYAAAEYSREEKIMSSLIRSRRRKNLHQIARNIKRGNWPEWVLAGLEAARIAPSAVNRQPWCFFMENNGVIVVSMRKPGGANHFSKRLDCGIAMLHFELGARALGVGGRWEFLPSPDVARYVPVAEKKAGEE
ncbi:MAG: nitroreductase family protein [Bacillota bacterium]